MLVFVAFETEGGCEH